jgi:hypothetical protein
MLKYRHSYTCVEVSRILVNGVAGIYRLILGTFPIVDPASGAGAPTRPPDRASLLEALRRAGPRCDVFDLGKEPQRSLRNHSRAPRQRNHRPKLLGHEGHPAGLSNGLKPKNAAEDNEAVPGRAPESIQLLE